MLGENPIFSWKSKSTQAKEQEEYAKWAFPYGQKQRDNLTARLLEAFPKESAPTTLIPFLTCKELFENSLKKTGSRSAAIDNLINTVKRYKRVIRKNEMTKYLAFVLADADIDESSEYPPTADILRKAEELEKLKTNSK